MSDLVMRLETAAAKCDQSVRETLSVPTYDGETLSVPTYDQLAADWRELFREAAVRIKQLEHEANAAGIADW